MPERFREPSGQWTAIADDPLVFMTNDKFLKENNLKAPTSWNDLLAAPYKNMLQMADARTSGTAVTRIFSILEVNGRDENKAFAYMKKLRPNVQLYTKSGGGGTLPVGLGQAGGGIFFIVDALDTKATNIHPVAAPVVWLAAFELVNPVSSVNGWVEHADSSPPNSPPATISVLRI